jgi:hypothetical protein
LWVVRRVRVWPISLALAGLSAAMWRSDQLQHWGWVNWLPTDIVVRVDHWLGNKSPPEVRGRVVSALSAGTLSPRLDEMAISSLIHELRDDNVEWNAMGAAWQLRSLRIGAVPALERALHSPDWQTRQFAASILREHEWGDPSGALIAVTVEGLRSDDLPDQRAEGSRRSAYSYVNNGKEGVEFLAKHARSAVMEMSRALANGDDQQKLLCAVAAGLAGLDDLLPAAAPVLIEHLGGNDVGADATLAQAGLIGFGPRVVEYLSGAMDGGDVQRQKLLRRVLERVRREEYAAARAAERGEEWAPRRLDLSDVYFGDLR